MISLSFQKSSEMTIIGTDDHYDQLIMTKLLLGIALIIYSTGS